MTASLAFPLLITLVMAAAATSAHGRLPPQLAARLASVGLVVVALAAIPTALVVAIAFLAHVPVLGLGFEWCAQAFGLHGSVPGWIGLPVVVLLASGTIRTVRLLRQHGRMRCHSPRPVHIADSLTPYAVTLPGRAGQIVLSTAMVAMLDPQERAIVLAHERAHARYRHDRYLLVAELAAAALPPLRALSRRVTYSIERWADEAAAVACGDRRLVAVTLGRVALHNSPATVAGFSGLGVADRMRALLAPPVSAPGRQQMLALWGALTVAAGFSLYQPHHVEQLLTALCPH
jgi:Zn-dependent protease with chaperone function